LAISAGRRERSYGVFDHGAFEHDRGGNRELAIIIARPQSHRESVGDEDDRGCQSINVLIDVWNNGELVFAVCAITLRTSSPSLAISSVVLSLPDAAICFQRVLKFTSRSLLAGQGG
jgi:hypothetical protein